MTSIEGFSKYLIYENGDIYTNGIRKGFMKPYLTKKGYKRLNLRDDNGKLNRFYIHRLVALAYIPNPENKPQVDHIDQNKTNNHLSNLRWASIKENQHNIKQPSCNNKLGEKNICLTTYKGYKYYRFIKKIDGTTHQKHFKTLEEAISYKNNYLSSINNDFINLQTKVQQTP